VQRASASPWTCIMQQEGASVLERLPWRRAANPGIGVGSASQLARHGTARLQAVSW
jgi:hypothetical protein